jgi:hypothetical protein
MLKAEHFEEDWASLHETESIEHRASNIEALASLPLAQGEGVGTRFDCLTLTLYRTR